HGPLHHAHQTGGSEVEERVHRREVRQSCREARAVPPALDPPLRHHPGIVRDAEDAAGQCVRNPPAPDGGSQVEGGRRAVECVMNPGGYETLTLVYYVRDMGNRRAPSAREVRVQHDLRRHSTPCYLSGAGRPRNRSSLRLSYASPSLSARRTRASSRTAADSRRPKLSGSSPSGTTTVMPPSTMTG